jgi:hypothetical protein
MSADDRSGRGRGTPQPREDGDRAGGKPVLWDTATPATRPPCRRFTLFDAMILVGGVAMGFAGFQSVSNWSRFDRWFDFYIHAYSLLTLFSILILTLRLRRPRPPIRRIVRQPGTLACFTAVAFGLLCNCVDVIRSIFHGQISDGSVEDWMGFFLKADRSAAYVVAIVWVIFALGRLGRPESGWIDPSGRLVGWLWIVWGLAWPFLE